jgi:hypothetical protein
VRAFITAGGGFLLAVLWFDLMFDVQVRGRRERELPEDALGSIASYYRRVTTAARPMNRLLAVVMLATLVAIVVQLARGDQPAWISWTSLALAAGPILPATVHTVPSAVRLAARTDQVEEQSRLARSIFRDHLLSAASITALLVVQLGFA